MAKRVTMVYELGPDQANTFQVRTFFLIAFALSWGIGGIALIAGRWVDQWRLAPAKPLYYLAGYAISATGIVLTARYDGRRGLRRLAHRLVPTRPDARWIAIVVLAYGVMT